MKKINIYSFCDNSKSSIRPILKGAYCNNGFITATDAYIAFKIREKYPSEHEDKVVTKDGEMGLLVQMIINKELYPYLVVYKID